jgi:TRAP-type C4-dicarboxylate transport system substrate-binding protein
VQTYLITTGHVFDWGGIYMSQRLLERLPEDIAEIVLREARQNMTVWGNQASEEMGEVFRQRLLAGGMQEISDINVADFTNRLLPIYEGFFNDGTWTSSLEEILSFAN